LTRAAVDEERIRAFVEALARAASGEATLYLVGGATAVMSGWRATTIDIDLRLEPEDDGAMRALPRLKDDLSINVELASPLDFLPELPGWRDRSPFVLRVGSLTVRQFDLYAQALAKLERGFAQDLADVDAMVSRGLVLPGELLRLFEAIVDELYRFPAVDADDLRSMVEELLRPGPGPVP
jgi:hypothetical protein